MPQPTQTVKRGRVYSRQEKLQIRRLYLFQGLSPMEIAEKVDYSLKQIQQLVHREGWTKQRRIMEEEAAKQEERSLIEMGQREAMDFVESVSTQGQEMAEKGFQLARSSGEGKDFAFAMSGTKTAVQLARQAMGMDAKGEAGQAPSIAALFVMPVSMPAREPKPVEQVEEEVEELHIDFEE